MVQNSPDSPIVRRNAPIWVLILVGVLLLSLVVFVVFLGWGVFRSQHPILSEGSKVTNFTLKLFDGYSYQGNNQIRLSDLHGKVVVVNFWASWCVTCADEAPYVESAWKQYEPTGQVVFIGVDYTDVDSKALAYLSNFKITYPNGPDLGTRITPIFNRNIAMPETYILDQEGVLRFKQIGPFQSEAEIRSVIDPLLSGN
jgi:cytochrome c biogenesis protein CcmG, thiol:disulfide interchange protein DsbE